MMTPIPYSLLAQALGLAVLHTLWQVALIWLVFKISSTLLKQRHQAVYWLAITAMLGAAFWFFTTFFAEFERLSAIQAVSLAPSNVSESIASATIGTSVAAVSWTVRAMNWLEMHTREIGWAWGICVAFLWLRLLGGWWMTQQLRYKGVVRPDAAFEAQCRQIVRQLNIPQAVQLLESPLVREPLTLGFWKPVILFPVGMLLQLNPAQVEALLVHELAHIRRYDYLINLVQLALETCFFYHPLFWLISRDARVSREFCCDDVVLRYTNDPIMYARTLTDLQILKLQPLTPLTMNATGKSRFTERIWRIAGITPKRESRPSLFVVMLLPLMVALCSWWPTQAAPDTESLTSILTNVTPDTLPPAKAAKPATAAKPKEKAPSAAPAEAIAAPIVAIEARKMNVFYIGVDNPLNIAVSGYSPADLKVELIGEGTITGSHGKYNAVVTTPGSVKIRVSGLKDGKVELVNEQEYRVKRIPDPVIRLGTTGSNVITKEYLLAHKSVVAMLTNFDFDAVCNVIGYDLTVLPKGGDPVTMTVKGSEIPTQARQVFESLSGNGDAVFFDDIKVLCPGDAAPRNIGGLAYKLKS